MEMTIQTADFSNRVSGQGIFPPVQILTPILLGLLTGPGFASGARSCLLTNFPNQRGPGVFTAAAGEAASPVMPAGELVTAIREGWGLNMSELAEICGVSRPTLYNWLKGKPVADPKVLHHLQVLAAAAGVWKHYTERGGQDFLLDYTGPQANQESIRQAMSRPDVSADGLRDLVESRREQYRVAREQTRTILGESLPLPATSPPESARRLNKLWADNAKALHAARKRNH
jgi:transcriptional regulator with XRE-family HTH domain